jgi:sulfur-carrier protein adenylyltransferase/sulfurtransferase
MQDEWLRYSCQLALPGFGKENQLKLHHAKVLIVGAGGLGCPAAQYLAASGIGTIGIADFDVISISNLHRQILYSPAEVGLLKAKIACKKLHKQNPQTKLVPITEKITSKNVMDIFKEYDIILDGTDNFETKYLLNDACVLSGKPLVYAAIYQYEGQVSLLNVLNKDGSYSHNYRDLFPDVNAAQIPNCAEGGVIPTIAGIIGCIQANEAIKYITKSGDLLAGKIFMIDARTLQSRMIKIGTGSKTIISELPESEHVNVISAYELKDGIDENLFELIDVRTADERMGYNIGGKHIPLSEIDTNFSLIDFSKRIVFYCESGRRSTEAVKIAKKRFPHADIFSLEGGMKAWKEIESTINEKI